jgi:hypothetical protein
MLREGRRPKPDGGDWGANPHGPDLPLGAAISCRDGTQPAPIILERACYEDGRALLVAGNDLAALDDIVESAEVGLICGPAEVVGPGA